ncbi:MAG TPA: hypothetical protein VMG58_02485 [Candidatus Sulfotelmatobacter sp.]|nr:hypothetical protein [Candidatus Sulfotelmatobacter sp.]
MPEIPEATIEQVWQEVSQLPPAGVPKEMDRIGRRQPDLMAFVLAATDDRRVEVREVAIYLFYIIVRVFERATAGRLPRVGDAELERQFKRNTASVKRCGSEQQWFQEQGASAEMPRQSPVVQSLLRALLAESKSPDDTEEVGLREEELGTLFFALKTALDALEEARAVAEAAPNDSADPGSQP